MPRITVLTFSYSRYSAVAVISSWIFVEMRGAYPCNTAPIGGVMFFLAAPAFNMISTLPFIIRYQAFLYSMRSLTMIVFSKGLHRVFYAFV